MDLKNAILGGRAAFNGIYFATTYFTVLCREHGEGFQLIKYDNSFTRPPRWFYKIPFIRAAIKLSTMFQLIFPQRNRKLKALLLTIAVLLLLSDVHALMYPEPHTGQYPVKSMLYLTFGILSGLVITGKHKRFIGKLKKLFSYHGAEHKAINAVLNGQPVTEENVANQSRISPRCGTVLIAFYFPVLVIVNHILSIPTFVGVIIALLVSMELFLLTRHLFFRVLFYPFILIGKGIQFVITTREPDEKQIRAAAETVHFIQITYQRMTF